MPTYVMRDIHQAEWDDFTARANREGVSVRQLFAQFVREYGTGAYSPVVPLMDALPLRVTCSRGHVTHLRYTPAEARTAAETGQAWCHTCGENMPIEDAELRERIALFVTAHRRA